MATSDKGPIKDKSKDTKGVASPAPAQVSTATPSPAPAPEKVEKVEKVIQWTETRIDALVRIGLGVAKVGGSLLDIVRGLRSDPAFAKVAKFLDDESGPGKVSIQLGTIRKEQKKAGKPTFPTFRQGGGGSGPRKVINLGAIEAAMKEAGL